MSCGISVIKYILFLVNVICALAGMALIILGSIAIATTKQLESAEKRTVILTCGFIIALGIVIFLISFFGCCGAIRESHCMTMTYAVILLILLLAEIGIIAFVFISNAKGGELFDEMWKNKDNPGGREAIDVIQRTFECCGKYGPGDFYAFILPETCCPISETNCTYITPTVYLRGCFDFMDYITKTFVDFLLAIIMGICTVTGFQMFMAFQLARHFLKIQYKKIPKNQFN